MSFTDWLTTQREADGFAGRLLLVSFGVLCAVSGAVAFTYFALANNPSHVLRWDEQPLQLGALACVLCLHALVHQAVSPSAWEARLRDGGLAAVNRELVNYVLLCIYGTLFISFMALLMASFSHTPDWHFAWVSTAVHAAFCVRLRPTRATFDELSPSLLR